MGNQTQHDWVRVELSMVLHCYVYRLPIFLSINCVLLIICALLVDSMTCARVSSMGACVSNSVFLGRRAFIESSRLVESQLC